MAVQELVEIKFRLADGSDIGPNKYASSTTVGSLKEKLIAQWSKAITKLTKDLSVADKDNGPRTTNDVKLINAGRILENSRALGESRLPGGVITMHVVVRPPNNDQNNGKLKEDSATKGGCACTIL
ncbi:hypothetical protein RND71_026850 [Anisodus tanguticus]|uniref:UBL3-like ubiquitin domain-containing protein n=1 Tax=Anisodus tanguticus TaxID=243964 RepID=A0AAE1V8N8_9SOLA|nr:hypothetical protein RND71_026850 [Anisodus tanguticus]